MQSEQTVIPNEPSLSHLNLDGDLSFSQYINQCRAMIQERRTDLLNQNANNIINANCPFELYPQNPLIHNNRMKYGALLIHGLWDSPFSLKDVGLRLQDKGILSRAVLLPGHGTRPSDLHQVSYQDWIQTVAYGINSLQSEVEQIYLIGYSAGAALSIYHALNEKNNIAGIILLSPAIRVQFFMDIVFSLHQLSRWAVKQKEWIFFEDEIDYAKYRSIGFNPALQIYTLTKQ